VFTFLQDEQITLGASSNLANWLMSLKLTSSELMEHLLQISRWLVDLS